MITLIAKIILGISFLGMMYIVLKNIPQLADVKVEGLDKSKIFPINVFRSLVTNSRKSFSFFKKNMVRTPRQKIKEKGPKLSEDYWTNIKKEKYAEVAQW